ncbi:MAG: UDP-N-Acetylglucosamine 2-epimerase [Bryobacterales bacterium]|nr:UDP-N-Acetylglucosamine 2-epimerase [Bryobacterales bacterium]
MTSPRAASPTGTNRIPSPPSHPKSKVLVVLGTRPEAIKLAPVILQLRRMSDELETVLCVTAQHRSLLDGVLQLFELYPEFDLDLMRPGQTLTGLTSRMLGAMEPVLEAVQPDLTLVQGDTTTTYCGALASFYAGVRIAHVEAGLRTFDVASPFPEEMNRAATTQLASLHFAPTEQASENLVRAGVPRRAVHVTGNTGIDAVLHVAKRLEAGMPSGVRLPLAAGRKLIVITAHRRESFGNPFRTICNAVAELARREDVQIVWPVHPNPNIEPIVRSVLAGKPNVHLIEPLEYAAFIDLLRKAFFVITDSGGVQEEGPSLGKPVLVLRNKTERPEAISVGAVKLVGYDPERIVREATLLLEDPSEHERMSRTQSPYGDGQAGERIAAHIRDFLRAGVQNL